MADETTSLRTPLSRAKGLGASGGGTDHFWRHRITAVANLLLVFPFVVIVALVAGRSYADSVAIVSHPLAAILLALFVISVTIHMRLGMQTVIEDYVHGNGAKIAALIANTFFAVSIGAAGLFAILKIGFGPVL